jgi:plasmid replication initiation protein
MKPLLPERQRQLDFFVCNILDAVPKDDLGSMEHPMFTLSTKPDKAIRHYEHNGSSITIAPGAYGLATIYDKDILIYVISQLVEALNRGRGDVSRTVRLTAYDLLTATNRGTGGREYDLLERAFQRLQGTQITTNIATNGVRIREGFGLIDHWRIVEKCPGDARMLAIQVTLSEWLYNAVMAREVLSLNRDYFRLRKAVDRRVYELARKHCGRQTTWKIHLSLLHKKTGATCSLREFRRSITTAAKSNHLPNYYLFYDHDTDAVTFWRRSRQAHADDQGRVGV